MERIRAWSKPEVIIFVAGLVVIALVAVQMLLMQAAFTRVMPFGSAVEATVWQEWARDAEILLRYSWLLILLAFAMFVGLALMLIRNRRTAEEFSAAFEHKIKERTLQLEYERNLMRTLIDNVPDFIYAKDAQSRFTLVNAPAVKLYGAAAPAELIGKTEIELEPDARARQSLQDEQLLFETRNPLLNHEEQYVDPTTRQARWVSSTKIPLCDADGKPMGLVGVKHDITAIKRTEEALQRRADEFAALYEISSELASQTDVSSLLETIVARARQLLKTPWADMALYDAERGDLVFVVIQSRISTIGSRRALGEGVLGMTAATRKAVYVNDYQNWPQRMEPYVEAGIRAVLAVPMLYGGELIGVLNLIEVGESDRKFDEADARLLSLFAAQAASAVHNARLLEKMQDALAVRERSEAALRQQTARLRIAADLGRTATAILEIDHVLPQVAELLSQYFGFYHIGLFVIDETGKWAVLKGNSGVMPHPLNGAEFRLPVGVPTSMIGYVTKTGKMHITDDVAADPLYYHEPTLPDVHSEAAFPLIAGGKIIGALDVSSDQKNAFTADDISILSLIADQTAVAIQNARLFEAAQAELVERERAEAETRQRNRELEAVNRLSTILTTNIDTAAALEQMAREMVRIFHARNCGIALLNQDATELTVIADALEHEHEEHAVGIVIPVIDNPSSQYVIDHAVSLIIPNVQTDPRTKHIQARMRQRGSQCLAIIPLLSHGKVIGTLGLDTRDPEYVFSDQEIRLAETMANHIADAIEKQRMFDQTQNALQETKSALAQVEKARRRLTLQYETARILTEAAALEDATPRLLETICRELNWQSGEFWQFEPHTNLLRCVDVWYDSNGISTAREGERALEANAALAEFAENNRGLVFKASEGMFRRVYQEGAPVSVLDVADDPDFKQKEEAVRAGIKSVFGFPLLSGANIIGIGFFFSTVPQPLLAGEATTLTTLGRQVGQFMERKLAEEKLRESERMLAKAQEIAHIGSWRWEFEPERLQWSDEMYRIFGLEREKLPDTLASIVEQAVHPDDLARIQAANERSMRGIPSPMEYRVVHPNGTERVVWGEGESMFDADGKPIGMVGIVQDITERKRAQSAERQLAAIVESSNDAIVSKTLDGMVTSWNRGAERLHGYTASEMMGQTVDVIVPPEYRAESEAAQAQLLEGKEIVHLETERFRKDGSRVQVALTFSPLLNDSGQIVGTSAIARDITERKRAEAELRRQNAYLDALHETTINLMGRLQLNDLLQTITQRAARLVGTTHGYIYLHEPDADDMEMSVGVGIFAEMVGTKARRRIGATGIVWDTGQVLVVDDYQTWEGRVTKAAGTSQLRSLVSVPLKSGDELVGVFGLAHTDAHKKFDEAAVELLTRFAHLASIALDNARLYSAAQLEIQVRKQAEARFKLLFEASPDAILLLDPNQLPWPIVDCNQVACEMNGYTRDEMIGQSIDFLNTSDGTPEERAEYLEEIRRTGVLRVESEHRHKDGHLLSIETSTSLLKVGDRELVLGIDRDVTERKRVENALRENRARLASLMNNTDDLMMSIDRDLRLTIFNEPFRHLVEYGEGRKVYEGVKVLDLVEPETHATHLEYYARAFAGERCRYETEHVLADGIKFAFETYLNPIYDDQREITGLAIFTRDITERKAAEQAVRQQKELLQTVFDNIPVMIGMFDARGHYTLINREWQRTLGFGLDTMNQGDVMAKMYPDVDQRLAARGFMFAPTPGWRDFKTLVRDGNILDTSWAYTPLSDGNTIAFAQDITQRKEVDRLKNEFISTVSHELRTPLTSIRGSLGLIAGGVAGNIPERVKNMIDIAYKNSERLVRLINDILDIEKIESGKMVFQFKLVELVPLIEHAIEANRSYGEQYQVTFAMREAVPNVQINGDADRLVQVMTNLLSNAAKFSRTHTQVEISVRREGKFVRVAVSDHGAGIPEEFKSHIFQKFAQADSSDTRQKGGTGLGLSIVKAIIEKHGGIIGFDSTPGVGTTFYFELPEYQYAPSLELAPESHKPRILIVEDDHDVALLLNMMLRQGGFETDVAYNAARALEMLHARRYAAVTLDLMLPDNDGISLIRDLRAHELTRDLPIVVVSAKAEQGKEQLNGDAIWVADWLQKPIDQQQLVRAVAHAAQRLRRDKPHILHIEDDLDVLRVVQAILQDTADVTAAADFVQARELLERELYDLVILDPALPDGSGMDLLPLLRRDNARIPIVIFSAREEDPQILKQVNAALVKSRTTNDQLLKTITHWIEPNGDAPPSPVARAFSPNGDTAQRDDAEPTPSDGRVLGGTS